MIPDDPAKVAVTAFSGIGSLAVILKLWRMLSSEKPQTAKDSAETDVYARLRQMIEEDRNEITMLKEKLASFEFHFRVAQEIAVNILMQASQGIGCQHCREVQVLALKIIRNEMIIKHQEDPLEKHKEA